jgi:hypothetical protein
MPECIHGLDFASCDSCSPPKRVEPVEVKRRAVAKAPAAGSLKAKAPQRLHVVLFLEEFVEALEAGELIDPIYYHGPEELAWGERRRSPRATEQLVLVVGLESVTGLDVLPLTAVQLIAVSNTYAQEHIRDLLEDTELSAKVAVYPPWFMPPED